jgi:hypothetical protein
MLTGVWSIARSNSVPAISKIPLLPEEPLRAQAGIRPKALAVAPLAIVDSKKRLLVNTRRSPFLKYAKRRPA